MDRVGLIWLISGSFGSVWILYWVAFGQFVSYFGSHCVVFACFGPLCSVLNRFSSFWVKLCIVLACFVFFRSFCIISNQFSSSWVSSCVVLACFALFWLVLCQFGSHFGSF